MKVKEEWIMKGMISKIISGGLAAILLFTVVPAGLIHAEDGMQASGTEAGAEAEQSQEEKPQEPDWPQLPEEEIKSPDIGYGETGTEDGLSVQDDVRGADVDVTDSGDCSGEKGEVRWQYQDGKLTIRGSGRMEDFPSGAPWYKYNYSIDTVEVGKGVTNIGEAAFYACFNLENVSLPNTLKMIGKGAFVNCPNLKELVLPDKVTKIEEYAFQNCGMREITLPSSLKSLAASAFFRCRALEQIKVPSANQNYMAQDGVLFSKDGKRLLCCPANKTTGSYTIPSGVTRVDSMAFILGKMTGIIIPQSVESIGTSAFQQSEIASLVIPGSVTQTEEFICYGCENLKEATVKPGLKALSRQAFQRCYALEHVNLGKVTGFNREVFSYCSSLKEVEIPKGTKAIADGSFEGCAALEKVTLPPTVREIGCVAFSDCSSLTEINFPKGLKVIYSFAFDGCAGLESVNLPSSIQEIGEEAFPSTTKLNNIPGSLTQQEDGSYVMAARVKIKGKEIYSQAFKVLKKVNSERKKAGKGSLKMDKKLLDTAMKRAMETSIYWGHTRPNGLDCFTASDLMMAENIAAGASSASGVMSLWMDSAGHKANILNEKYTSIGVGCVEVAGRRYWVQCFGTEVDTVVTAKQYKDKSKARTVSVSPDKKYYNPTVQVNGTKVKIGKALKVSVTWDNGYANIKIPASSLEYSSSDKSVCTVSKGVIKGVGNGTAKIKIWFPGYKKGAVTKKVKVGSGS